MLQAPVEGKPTKIVKRGLDAPTQLIAMATLDDGRTADVTAAATWESSAAGVVKVDGGLVTAVGFGSATITATYEGQRDSAIRPNSPPIEAPISTGGSGCSPATMIRSSMNCSAS